VKQELLHPAPGLCIEGAERLIHKDDFRPQCEAGDGDPLLHASESVSG
jgi:hypothetical protein